MNGFIVDARQTRLITEGDDDALRQFAAILPSEFETFIAVVESKLPLAVEVEPLTANKLWTRILGARNRWFVGHRLINKIKVRFSKLGQQVSL
jgi:hypothetical protein